MTELNILEMAAYESGFPWACIFAIASVAGAVVGAALGGPVGVALAIGGAVGSDLTGGISKNC